MHSQKGTVGKEENKGTFTVKGGKGETESNGYCRKGGKQRHIQDQRGERGKQSPMDTVGKEENKGKQRHIHGQRGERGKQSQMNTVGNEATFS
jgi:hypothetical protein